MRRTSRPCWVSARMAVRTAWMSSSRLVVASPLVEGRSMATHLYCWASRRDVTLVQISARCHAPGIKTSVGLWDMVVMAGCEVRGTCAIGELNAKGMKKIEGKKEIERERWIEYPRAKPLFKIIHRG